MAALDFQGKWVLVTGASSGLGYEMAMQLALKHKANLFLVARRAERLSELKALVESQTDSEVITLSADLSRPDEIDSCMKAILDKDNLYAAILNAGITYFGRHADLEWSYFESMLQTNVVGMVKMTNALTAYFEKKQGEAGIMVVSSMAAVLPTPFQAAYSGTKGFMLNFISALAHERSNKQLSYTVYLPGGMQTEMTNNDKFSPLKSWLMPVQRAAEEGINALRKRKATYIPGATNKLGAVVSGIISKSVIIKGMAKTYGNALKKGL